MEQDNLQKIIILLCLMLNVLNCRVFEGSAGFQETQRIPAPETIHRSMHSGTLNKFPF